MKLTNKLSLIAGGSFVASTIFGWLHGGLEPPDRGIATMLEVTFGMFAGSFAIMSLVCFVAIVANVTEKDD